LGFARSLNIFHICHIVSLLDCSRSRKGGEEGQPKGQRERERERGSRVHNTHPKCTYRISAGKCGMLQADLGESEHPNALDKANSASHAHTGTLCWRKGRCSWHGGEEYVS
ncbi:unnamed protein product, partial [Ectocarpus sp. 12 AP-2014]